MNKIRLHKASAMVFIVGLACLTLGLLTVYHTINYNSDDVVQKVLVHQTAEVHHTNIYTPPDNFLLKLPFNVLVDRLVASPSKNIFISAWLLDAFTMLMFFMVGLYFVRKYTDGQVAQRIFWLAFLLLCANSSTTFLYDMRSPQIRTIEIGCTFVLLLAIDKLVLRKPRTQLGKTMILKVLLLAVLAGVLVYSDPAFLVFLIISILLAGTLRYKQLGRDKCLQLGVFVVGAAITYEILGKVFTALGVHLYKVPSSFVTWDKLWSNLSIATQGLLSLQNAMVFGLPLFKASTLLMAADLLVLVIAVVYIPRKLAAEKDKDFWLLFFALQPIFLFAAYFLSNNVVDVFTSRYLILIPFYVVLLLAIGFRRYWNLQNKLITAGALCLLSLMVIGQVGINAKAFVRNRHDNPNAYATQVASVVKSLHVSKGYATYWNAGVTSFYSHYAADVFPLSCGAQPIKPYYWSVNATALERPSAKSFIIVSNGKAQPGSAEENSSQNSLCTDQNVIKQFGSPATVRKVTNYTEIFVYPYDVLTKMPKRINYQTP